MSDPLSLLRQATIAGRVPKLLSAAEANMATNVYVIEGHQFPDTARTAFRRTLKSNDYYSIRDVVFFLENLNSNFREYRLKAVEMRVAAVVETDRADLTNYLQGKISTCPQIDAAVAAEYAHSTQNIHLSAAAATAAIDMEVDQAPSMSPEEMEEQRLRVASDLDMVVQRSKAAAINESEEKKVNELRELKKAQKRKNLQAFGDEDPVKLKEFLEADRKILQKLRADDFPAHTRSSILNATSQDFSFVLKVFHDKVLRYAKKESEEGAGNVTAASATKPHTVAAAADQKQKQQQAAAGREASSRSAAQKSQQRNAAGGKGGAPSSSMKAPIIIVPNAPTSLLTTLNISDLLVSGEYISTDEKKNSGARKERELLLVRQKVHAHESTQHYKVIDDASKLQSESEWDRVVAVFVSGHAWQFKGWKISDPVNLFQNVLGIHVVMDGQTVDPVIQSWNCKVLKLNQFKQHLNATVARTFWQDLDDHIRVKKPHLISAPVTAAKIAAKIASGEISNRSSSHRGHQHHRSHGSGHGSSGRTHHEQQQKKEARVNQHARESAIPPPPPPPPVPPSAMPVPPLAMGVPPPPRPPVPPSASFAGH